jgi:preprotein translocase subunit YajC
VIVNTLGQLGGALLAQDGGGNPLGILILLLPIAAIIYLTVIPQRKQRQKQADLMRQLEVGDEVVTIGGIIGTINYLEGDEAHLEVDTDVVVRFSKSALASKVPAEGEESAEPPKSRWSTLLGGGAGKAEDDS